MAAKKPVTTKRVKKSSPAVLKPLPPYRRLWQLIARGWRKFAVVSATPGFARRYVALSLLVLLVTTITWSWLGARLQTGNADQLIDPYLFQSGHTFQEAVFPGAHSFLIKWPVFWLVKLLAYSGGAFLGTTIACSLLTVGALAFVLYKIERRPLVFGTLCLALASCLFLVPTQPYAGGLLPVNMAMLASRNLEYIVFLAGLYLTVCRPFRLRNRSLWVGIGLLGLLIASDKLFLTFGIGGALIALIVYALARRWNHVSLAVHYLVGVGLAAALGFGLLGLLTLTGTTHLANEVGASPYQLVDNLKDVSLGILYAFMGVLTNFGANPAYDATVVRQLPHQALSRLLSPSGPSYVINALILLVVLAMASRLLLDSLIRRKGNAAVRPPLNFAILLVWTAVTAVASFVASRHYYAVDARYLTISVFALFIAAASYLRTREAWPPVRLAAAGSIIMLGIILGIFSVIRTYQTEGAALADTNRRNLTVAAALAHHHVDVLVGDYWRSVPVKFASGSSLNILPLGACTQPRTALTSGAWQPNLRQHSFAYLLTLDRSLTDYPHCSLDQVVAAYGKPNASALIAGSFANPKEALLFYDHGAHPHQGRPAALRSTSTVLAPTPIDQLTGTGCSGPTIMTVVAHQDDDLLFTSPDLLHDVAAGYCIRTVYLTAGDSGHSNFYWLERQQGSEAAYAQMLGGHVTWVQHVVRLSSHEFVTIANPTDNTKVSLIFMNLPDGGVHGTGFAATAYESLQRLLDKHIDTMYSVDGQSSYGTQDLTDALETLMHTYGPTEIHTQANYASSQYPDHSDHIATGTFTKQAYDMYESRQFNGLVAIPLHYYIGYPIHGLPANVEGDDLQQKQAAFAAYSRFDGATCISAMRHCGDTIVYDIYLAREYQ